ncbi:unnamed protein product [Adineta steineri]|uniref:Apple domain-containing protein n=1 Tax=Adineta steineri TaxID=433720 RepID=A0A816FGE4_9BILA|nr:unnamed protein product [Adineta steineri]CAF1551248.1 unnamed protein product [Adineta steineri]CAF1661238.1 unnamed protein product [Adineta steineri]CAF1661269.1 unnamed protein product [Adineta steineri]
MILQNLFYQSLSATEGSLSADYGRISNMPDDSIFVTAASTLTDCIRQCVDFERDLDIYVFDQCFAYNYQIDQYTCELIHSVKQMNYTVGFQTRWITGLKY